MRLNLIFLTGLILLVSVNSKADDYNVYEINNANSEFSFLKHCYFHETNDTSLDISQIINLKNSNQFVHPSSHSFGFSDDVFWFYIKIRNNYKDFYDGRLSVEYPLLNYVDFYWVHNNEIVDELKTGERRLFSTRKFLNRNFVIPVEIKPYDELELYIRVFNDGETTRIPIYLRGVDEFNVYESTDNNKKGVFYGMLAFVIFFSLFIFIRLREKLYLYYFLYVTFLFLFLFNTDGYSFLYFWPNNPWWANHSTIFFVLFANLFMFLFSQIFLRIKEFAPKINQLINLLIFMVLAVLPLVFVDYPYYMIAAKFVNFSSAFVMVVVMWATIIAMSNNYTPAKFILFSYILLLSGVLLYVLRNFGVVPNNGYTIYGVKVGFALQVLFMTLAVIERFKRMKEEANQYLEDEVQERTEEIMKQKEEIEAQRDNILEKNEELNKKTVEILKQNDEIVKHRNRLSEKNKEVTDSINYAKRIQDAVLPSKQTLNKFFPDNFILYKPRDIVSGDFYWFKEHNNKLIVTAADCTGHGVPGAILSMLGITYINEITNSTSCGDVSAAGMLNTLRENFIASLYQKDNMSKSYDGMDMALCIIDLTYKKKHDDTKNRPYYNLQFSGANNPLYILQKQEPGSKEKYKLKHIKGDKMPVGVLTENYKPFINHEIRVYEGDVIYVFTDGFVDQFGGPDEKKFKPKQFRDILLNNADKPMFEQLTKLQREFYMWKGNQEQVDDILVIGIRI